MKLTFLGAAGEVTGSSTLVQTGRLRILVDCGMFQGHDATQKRNRELGPVDPLQLDAVILTHAHLDHSGRLPLLAARGLRAPIFATDASCDVAQVILEDSSRLQQGDALRASRRLQRAGRRTVEPLYDAHDVEVVMRRFSPVPYNATTEIAPGVTVRFVEAGHILGSSSVILTATEDGATKTVVFSGDVGLKGIPFLRDPVVPDVAADLVVLESTYGDRDHRPRAETLAELLAILREAIVAGGRVLIPAFAIGRAQEVLYDLAGFRRDGQIPSIPIFLDSPMAIEAMRLYARHNALLDPEAQALVKEGGILRVLDRLHFSESADQSKALNESHDLAVIVAGSGMCDGGRIQHHLKHNLWRAETHVVIVGYQAAGTLGRRLVEGAREVRIFGEKVAVKARVHTLGGFSAHAGRTELLDWAATMASRSSHTRFVLNHGEPDARAALSEAIRTRLQVGVECPEAGSSVTL
ncbi:MAG: MBL fold metallo-hydrolase [Isosphaeraceae bacterium]